MKKEWQVDRTIYAVYAEQTDGTMTFQRNFYIANEEYYDCSKKMIINPYDELKEMQEYVNNMKQNTRTISLLSYYFHQYKNSKRFMNFDIPVGNENMFERAKRIYPSYKYLLNH